jgi:hypothetical protein
MDFMNNERSFPRPFSALIVGQKTPIRDRMKAIINCEDFAALLRAEQAMVFTFFDWSGQAHLSLKVFAEWESEWGALHSAQKISFFRLHPDEYRDSWDWLVQHARGIDGNEGGYGSVTWARFGKSIGFVRDAGSVGKETLSRLTDEYFGSTQAA